MYDPKSSKIKRLATLLSLAKQRSREGNLSRPRQLVEMARLWIANGITPPHYFAAGLYRPDLTWSDKCNILGPKRYDGLLHQVNDKRYEYVAYNKLVTGSILTTFGIPTPELYGFINETCGQTFDGHALKSCADLENLLRRVDQPVVCFKLVEGWGGQGFLKVSLDLDRDPILVRAEPQGPAIPLLEFWERYVTRPGLGYLCQKAVEQHPDTAVFNPTSVNTTRVWLYRLQPGQWELYAAVFRMGVGGRPVDNSQFGGLSTRVDLETGQLGPAFDESVDRPVFSVHPITKVQIEGRSVPHWDEVAPLCRRVGVAFPYLRLIGVDIAFSQDGPLVLEIEAWPADDQIGFGHGVRSLFEKLASGPTGAAEEGLSAHGGARGVIPAHAVDSAAGRR